MRNPSQSTRLGQEISHIVHYTRLPALQTQIGKNPLQTQNGIASANNVNCRRCNRPRCFVWFRKDKHRTPKKEISCSILRRKGSKEGIKVEFQPKQSCRNALICWS